MLFEDSFIVAAPVDVVWGFLWDVEKLAACVPGAERISALDERNFTAVLSAKIAYITARFEVKLKITEVEPLKRLVAIGEGSDKRLLDRLKFNTVLELRPASTKETEVHYKIDLGLFGKLGALGHSIIKRKAQQMAEEFAANIRHRLES